MYSISDGSIEWEVNENDNRVEAKKNRERPYNKRNHIQKIAGGWIEPQIETNGGK